MKKIVTLIAISCLCFTGNASAEGPIFLNKIKNTFSKNKPTIIQKAPPKQAKQAKQAPQPEMSYAPKQSTVSGRLRALSAANARSDYIAQKDYAEWQQDQAETLEASTQPLSTLESLATGQPLATQQTEKRIIIPKDPKKEENDGPKPIFRNFR